MERRRFLAVLVSVPVLGAWMGSRTGVAAAAEPDVDQAPGEAVAAAVWSALDHASSWGEAAGELRGYAQQGRAGSEAFGEIAELLERHAAGKAEPAGVLGLYPATVLTLAGLQALRLYGAPADHRRQVEIIRELLEVA